MFNSFISKFRNVLAPTMGDDGKHRVVYAPQVAAPTKEVAPIKPTPPAKPVVDDKEAARAEALIRNAKKIEADFKLKESEIFQRLSALNEKEKYLIQKEKAIDGQAAEARAKLESIDELYRKQLDKLEQISGLDIEKAKQLILSSTEKKMAAWIAKKISEAKDQLKIREDELAKEILLDGIAME